MRLFIAIEIPEGIKKEMVGLQEKLKKSGADASWPGPEGVHLTLKFLGEVPESKVEEIKNALAAVAGGTGPFRLEAAGAGTFPSAKNPRVAWLGVTGDIDKLSALQQAIEDAMRGVGFEQEEREFKPHLTLARIKYVRSRDAWQSAMSGIKDVRLPAFDVTHVSLMKSELHRTGAVYTEVARVELGK
jgi:2'-5' RNA ligase